jgi:hypothetical protein
MALGTWCRYIRHKTSGTIKAEMTTVFISFVYFVSADLNQTRISSVSGTL